MQESPDSDTRHSLLHLGTGVKAREFIDPIFQVLDLASEYVCLLPFTGRKSILQFLQTGLFQVLVDVDDQRTIVIYQHAIPMVIASEGQTTETREFTVKLWEGPPDSLPHDPDDLVTAFLNELLATTDTVRTEF